MMDKVLKGSEAHIHQVGVVVKDLDKTITFLSAIGLGPFTVRKVKHHTAKVRGKMQTYEVRIALAQQGPVQLELIEYVEGNTIHKEFLKDKGEGLHHIRFMVPDLDAAIGRFSEIGVNVLQEDRYVDGGGIAYMETDTTGGVIMEITETPPGFDPVKGAEYKKS